MLIKIDDLTGPEIAQLLQEHLDGMFAVSPAESVHALDIDALRQPEITMWTAWEDGQLCGCGALKELRTDHAEVKSMRTAAAHLRKGVAAALLQTILTTARSRGYQRLSLETGPPAHFAPAHALYQRFGFTVCGPFEGYALDPYSVFMTRLL
jgi:putative acetyltransferase